MVLPRSLLPLGAVPWSLPEATGHVGAITRMAHGSVLVFSNSLSLTSHTEMLRVGGGLFYLNKLVKILGLSLKLEHTSSDSSFVWSQPGTGASARDLHGLLGSRGFCFLLGSGMGKRRRTTPCCCCPAGALVCIGPGQHSELAKES